MWITRPERSQRVTHILTSTTTATTKNYFIKKNVDLWKNSTLNPLAIFPTSPHFKQYQQQNTFSFQLKKNIPEKNANKFYFSTELNFYL